MKSFHKSAFGSILILIVAAGNCFAIDPPDIVYWPFSPLLGFHDVDKTLGDWNPFPNTNPIIADFHQGLDIAKVSGTTVFAVSPGCAIWVEPDLGGPTPQGKVVVTSTSSAIMQEGWLHLHIAPSVRAGQCFPEGTALGTVADFDPGNLHGLDSFDHVHLSAVETDGIVFPRETGENPFRFFSTSLVVPPQRSILGPGSISFVSDQTLTDDSARYITRGSTVVFGNIDILVEAHTLIATSENSGTYNLGWAAARGIVGQTPMIPLREMVRFYDATDRAKAPLAYPPFTSSRGTTYGHYHAQLIVTNSDGITLGPPRSTELIKENAWFTRVRTGEEDRSGGILPSQWARTNAEARYPDGPYRVDVFAQSFTGDRKDEIVDVTIDNFRNFVTKVTIGDKFSKGWTFSGTQFVPSPDNKSEPLAPGSYPVRIEFSEPLMLGATDPNDNPRITIDGGTVVDLNPEGTAGEQQVLAGTLTIDAGLADGQHALRIEAKDLAGNQLLALGPSESSIDPSLVSRNDAGVMGGTGGADTSVTFKISYPQIHLWGAMKGPIIYRGPLSSTATFSTTADDGVSFEIGGAEGGLGLASISVEGPVGYTLDILYPQGTPPSDLGGVPIAKGIIRGPKGDYTIRVADRNGAVTVLPLKFANQQNALNPGSTSDHRQGQSFDSRLLFDFSSSLGFDRIEEHDASWNVINPHLPVDYDSDRLTGSYEDMRHVSTQPQDLMMLMSDRDGNTNGAALNLAERRVWATFLGPTSTPDGVIGPLGSPQKSGTYLLDRGQAGPEDDIGYATDNEGSVSATYNLFSSSMLPGAVMYGGFWETDPTTLEPNTTVYVNGPHLWEDPTIVSGPMPKSEKMLDYQIFLDDRLILSGCIGIRCRTPVPPQFMIALPSTFTIRVSMQRYEPTAVYECYDIPQDPDFCIEGRRRIPYVAAAGGPIVGVKFGLSQGPITGTWFLKGEDNITAPLGAGVELSGFSTIGAGPVSLLRYTRAEAPPLGYRHVAPNYFYDISASTSLYVSSFTLSFPFESTGLTAEQRSMIRIEQAVPNIPTSRLITPTSVGQGKVTLATTSFGGFGLVAPIYQTPAMVTDGDFSLLSNVQVQATLVPSGSSEIEPIRNQMRAKGLADVGPWWQMGPTGTTFSPPAVVNVPYDPALMQQKGVVPGSLSVYKAWPGGYEKLAGQGLEGNKLSAWVASFGSHVCYIAVFGTGAQGQLPDSTAPQTLLSYQGYNQGLPDGSTLISTDTAVSLSAYDPSVPGEMMSGIATTYYLLDRTYVDLSSTPPDVYSSSFTLGLGTHTLTYFSSDNAGNLEAPKISSISVQIVPKDMTPPQTNIAFQGYAAQQPDGSVVIMTETAISFNAVDPDVPGVPTSDVARTFCLLDLPFVDLDSTPPEVCYSTQPFTLESGAHFLTYFSQDNAGNLESPHVSSLTVMTPQVGTNPPGSVSVLSRSSASVELSWGSNGNPEFTAYYVNYGTAATPTTCDTGAGIFTHGMQVLGTYAGIRTLLPDSSYIFAVCTPGVQDGCATPIVVETRTAGQGPEQNPSYHVCGSTVSPPQPPPPLFAQGKGFSINVDSSGNLWELSSVKVSTESPSETILAKFSSTGVFISSVALPYAVLDPGKWTIRFGPSGEVMAIGPVAGPMTTGMDIGIYGVTPAGDAVLSFKTVDSGLSNNDFVFDSNGDLWIAGAVQTSGAPDAGPGEATYELALWKYDPADESVQLRSRFTSGYGFDAALGIAKDAQGNLWVAGYYMDPNTPGDAKMGLALWKFNSTGTQLLAGPIRKPGFLSAPGVGFEADVVYYSNAVYVSAARLNSLGNTDLVLLKYDLAGIPVFGQAWHSSDGWHEAASRMAVNPNGRIVIAGGSEHQEGGQWTGGRPMVWEYEPNGTDAAQLN